MNKLLIICGPTASGKTSLGLKLARIFNGEIVSADSRQVFKLMDIGTGKDIPKKFKVQKSKFKVDGKKVEFYTNGKIKIWGYDLVDPKERFSISDYRKIIIKVIKNIQSRNKLPIIVGGSGLYIKAITDSIDTINIAPDENLRKKLNKYSAEKLFRVLLATSQEFADGLNESDRKNPRRLIRKIEIAKSKVRKDPKGKKIDTLFIGLRTERDLLREKIAKRVRLRFELGFLHEVGTLKVMGLDSSYQSMQTPGYRQFLDFEDFGPAINEWINDEFGYSKRQMTWFLKNKRIFWYDQPLSKKGMESLVNRVFRWYKEYNV